MTERLYSQFCFYSFTQFIFHIYTKDIKSKIKLLYQTNGNLSIENTFF